ncbi:MAG: hypothetical protein E6J41_14455 [Chloroflexi bacterium]|nr:MAG: hypothetical protein E6J41_14455 [Chloroflexota bacterium]
MSVPFKDAAELDAGGTAAFLRILRGDPSRGALFQVNARGAPVEFTYNRVDLPSAALWRPEQLEREAAKALAASLFEAARRTPLVLLCLAAEVDAALFSEDLEVQIPVCRVAVGEDALPNAASSERADSDDVTAHLFWRPALPSAESPPRRLVTALTSRGLLLEPFERALAGLDEALGGA